MNHQSKPSSKSGLAALLPANWILPLRIFMGATFLYAGIQHLTDPAYFDPSKQGYIGHLVGHYAVGSPIHDFLIGVVQPNAVTFGYMVAVGESLIGVAVLLGFLYRIAALAGLFLNFTFFLSATWNAFPFYFGSDIVFVVCWLTLLFTGPQQGLSVDAAIAKRLPSLGWLAPAPVQLPMTIQPVEQEAPAVETHTQTSERAKLYPRQVAEVNRAFDRIDSQFVSHEETHTILELARAFVISLGVDRTDSMNLLAGLRTLLERDTWHEVQPQTGEGT